MKWQIKISSKARSDIEAVLVWTLNNFGQNKHDEYVELLGLALNEIAVNPKCIRARQRPELHRNAWVIHIARRGRKARHLFIYRIDPKGHIEVSRFLHDSMDLRMHVPEDFGPASPA
jgi:toxin ParE1/3/4